MRSGGQVTTSYTYYQNGKTFKTRTPLEIPRPSDYDLYRKITRVTDPRGFIRQYEYDQNGLHDQDDRAGQRDTPVQERFTSLLLRARRTAWAIAPPIPTTPTAT